MARRARKPQPSSRSHIRVLFVLFAAIGLLVATCLALCSVLVWRPTLGVAGQHAYGYHPAPRYLAFLLLGVASLPLAATAAILFLRRGDLDRWRAWGLIALLCTGSLILHAMAATAPKALPEAELVWPFLWPNTEGAYAQFAARVGRLDRFVSNYPHLLDVSPRRGSPHWTHIHHCQVHPPGIIVAFAAADRFYGACPAANEAVTRLVATRFPAAAEVASTSRLGLRHPVAVSSTAALVTILLASVAPLVCYLALRGILPGRAVMAACLLVALVPGTYLFNPSVDQAYPTITLVLVGLALRAATTRRWPWGAAFGAALYGAMFLHVGFALVAVILGVGGLLAWRAWKPEWGARQCAVACWPAAFGAAMGFLTPAFILQLWLGYPTFRVILACLRNNRLFNAAMARTHWPWVIVTPFEFCLSLGLALGLVCIVGWARELAGAVWARSLRGRAALLLAAVGVLALLDVLGMNRGETARLWLFVTPLLVVGATEWLCRDDRLSLALVAALGFCQCLQLLVLRVVLDPNWTSSFFIGLSRQ